MRIWVMATRTGPAVNFSLMNVSNIMNTPVVTVEMDDELRVVKSIFDSTKFHHLLVVDAGKLCGVVSDRDLLKSLSPYVGSASETARDVATLKKKVHQVMTRKPVAVLENASIEAVLQIFVKHNFSCVPVVDTDNKPVGIVSWRDIIKYLVANQAKQSFNAYQDKKS